VHPRKALAFRVVAIGIGFLVLALASIALTVWVTWQLEGGAAAVNEAGRMRMMSYRIALNAAERQHDTVRATVAASGCSCGTCCSR
jgi:two-component system nitrate/nitrite sensor histidine kinase NarX